MVPLIYYLLINLFLHNQIFILFWSIETLGVRTKIVVNVMVGGEFEFVIRLKKVRLLEN